MAGFLRDIQLETFEKYPEGFERYTAQHGLGGGRQNIIAGLYKLITGRSWFDDEVQHVKIGDDQQVVKTQLGTYIKTENGKDQLLLASPMSQKPEYKPIGYVLDDKGRYKRYYVPVNRSRRATVDIGGVQIAGKILHDPTVPGGGGPAVMASSSKP